MQTTQHVATSQAFETANLYLKLKTYNWNLELATSLMILLTCMFQSYWHTLYYSNSFLFQLEEVLLNSFLSQNENWHQFPTTGCSIAELRKHSCLYILNHTGQFYFICTMTSARKLIWSHTWRRMIVKTYLITFTSTAVPNPILHIAKALTLFILHYVLDMQKIFFYIYKNILTSLI